MTSTRLLWALCLLAALVMIGAMIAFTGVPGQMACDGGTALDPLLRFEWMTTPAEFARFFGVDPCRTQLSLTMDAMNRIDVAAFIPAFTAFQLFAAWALRRDGRLAAFFVINAALIAGGCDMLEDRVLFNLAAIARMGDAVDPVWFGQLFWFVRVKFALLALGAIALGWLVGRRPGRGWMVACWMMMAGGAASVFGIFIPQLLTFGTAIAWLILLIVAIARVIFPGSERGFSDQG
ncbi:MAG: hypothetical protein AABZ45_03135 [Pseudomonadota bacterium]